MRWGAGRPSTCAARLVGAVVAAILLAGCQVKVAVDTHVERDGHGVLTVGVGLDDRALARVGDLDQQVRVGDLAAAGWTVEKAGKDSDGFTWLRASKPFASVDELNRELAELTGEPSMFRDFRLVDDDAGTAVVHRLTGTIDTSHGLAPFADQQLGARLGGEPVAAQVAAVEAAEGRKVADMVSVGLTASLENETRTAQARLDATAPVPIEVVTRDAKPAASVGGGAPLLSMAVAGAAVVAMLAAARRRFRRA